MNIGEAATAPKKYRTYSVLFAQVLENEGMATSATSRSTPRQRSVTVTAVDEYDAIAVAGRGWGIKPINIVRVRHVSPGKPTRNDAL